MRAMLIAAATLAVALPARALPKSYEFRVDLTSGPLAGESLRGTFVIDDSLLVPNAVDFSATGLGIAAIDFSIGGTQFTTANADAILLSFDTQGHLDDFAIGGAPAGYDQLDSSNVSPDFAVDGSSASYTVAGGNSFVFDGTAVHFQAVPEPAIFALLGLGTLALAVRSCLSA